MAWSTCRAGHAPEKSLRALDADLAVSIDRLERIRAALPVTRQRTPTDLPRADLPTASGAVTDDLSEADRTMLTIYAQMLTADGRFERLDPDLDVLRTASRRPDLAGSAVLAALREIYNPAQIDVLERAYARTAPGARPHTGARPTSTEASP